MNFGSVEAGGTKFVCAVGDETGKVLDSVSFRTTAPKETLAQVVSYSKEKDVAAIGVASFGPIELRPESPQYGHITSTPKLAWQNADFIGPLKRALDVPLSWTTDVNASAYGEYIAAKSQDSPVNSLVYYTIGTGVGAGCVYKDQFIGDLGHPEMGHVRVERDPRDADFTGICPFHGDCLEGLIAGPTFEERTGLPGAEVPRSDEAWDIMSGYMAQAAVQATLTLRPGKIVIGGSVANSDFLGMVRTHFANILNGYVQLPDLTSYLTMPIVSGNGSATLGNLVLAKYKHENVGA